MSKSLTRSPPRRWTTGRRLSILGTCAISGNLFDRTPHAEEKIRKWAEDDREFVRRAAFALAATYAVHAKEAPGAAFLPILELVERHSTDPRNFVKKAVNWALRQIGKRSAELHGPTLTLAEKLAASSDKTARWIGKDAARELKNIKSRCPG